jgi:hypothetical protein
LARWRWRGPGLTGYARSTWMARKRCIRATFGSQRVNPSQSRCLHPRQRDPRERPSRSIRAASPFDAKAGSPPTLEIAGDSSRDPRLGEDEGRGHDLGPCPNLSYANAIEEWRRRDCPKRQRSNPGGARSARAGGAGPDKASGARAGFAERDPTGLTERHPSRGKAGLAFGTGIAPAHPRRSPRGSLAKARRSAWSPRPSRFG